jgi:methyl-accepting chemotaxis protein
MLLELKQINKMFNKIKKVNSMSKTVSDQVKRFQTTVGSMKSNFNLLLGKGVKQEQLDKLGEDLTTIAAMNDEIDKLRTEVKKKSRIMNRNLVQVKLNIKDAKKIVKSNFEPSEWEKFGVLDKR